MHAAEESGVLARKEMILHMGPQHPSTHGVLKLILELEGEKILKCTPTVGYLHRGTEKLAENMTYLSALPLTDRLDYIASMINNVGYCIAVEKLSGTSVPDRAKYIRTMMSEMSRISSHLLWLGTHALDIGAMTVFMYAFREREKLLDLFELVCGARLTLSYARIGGVKNDITQEFIDGVNAFTMDFPNRIIEYETLIDRNRIWLKRTKGIGVITAAEAINRGLTGPVLRGSGCSYDVRKHNPYDAYGELDFDVPVSDDGDVYARYRCRMEELRQSTRLIRQCIQQLPRGPVMSADEGKFTLPPKESVLKDMEAMIHHFVLITKGPIAAPRGEIYSAVESPKGELGFYIVSDGSGKPYRLRLRTPSFLHVAALSRLCEGALLADAIANIGTVDIVMGDCDR
ncbi:MAG TPA: NADH dehydrogenase (quinone) subunit D [Dissulfurispiraceae bacterium]|nr:NADH dehydrogenase (quinone) subunit D [Dissulfurispiraceae bacterium]